MQQLRTEPPNLEQSRPKTNAVRETRVACSNNLGHSFQYNEARIHVSASIVDWAIAYNELNRYQQHRTGGGLNLQLATKSCRHNVVS